MQFRLMLDRDQLTRSRKIAREIATHLQKYVVRHTSTAIERAALRAMGVHGLHAGKPLTEAVIEKIGKDRLRDGAGYWLGYAMWEGKKGAQAAAQHLVKSGVPEELPRGLPHGEIRRMAREAATPHFQHLAAAAEKRDSGGGRRRRFIAAVETGNLARDCEAIKHLVKDGVDGVLLRAPIAADTEQLDAKTGGWRGQKYDLFDAIHKGAAAADGRHFIWGGNHLLAPETIVACGAEPIHAVEYDCLTLARCGGVHFKRAIVDQQFLYRFMARVGIGVSVASDHWRPLIDSYQDGHELLVGMMLIEAMGEDAGLPLEKIVPRHTLVIPQNGRADRLSLELAQAQLTRELFPQVPLGIAVDCATDAAVDITLAGAIANVVDFAAILLQRVGKEKDAAAAMQTALATARQANNWFGDCGDDLLFAANGKIIRRTHHLLEQAVKELQHVHRRDFLKLVAAETKGLLAMPDTGAGIDGVVQKGKYYWNPIEDWLMKK